MTDMTTATEALKLARDALAAIVSSTVRPTTPSDGAALNAGRAALAAIDALPAPSGEAVAAEVYGWVIWWLGSDGRRYPIFQRGETRPNLGAELNALVPVVAVYEAPQAAPAPQAEPVARVMSWTNGSHSRNYRLEWLRDVPEGTELYAAPQPAPAVAAPVQPLTEEQAQSLWVAATIERTDMRSVYLRGLRDGERAHGITSTPAKDSHE